MGRGSAMAESFRSTEAAGDAKNESGLLTTVISASSTAGWGCTASWAHNCNSNPTCCEAGFTCFEKTRTWAACLKTCTPGIVQPGDNGKQYPWTCRILGGRG